MARTIKKVTAPPKLMQRKKVAAYARVSSGKDAMLHSLSAQVTHYRSIIQNKAEWEFAGVYADEALTGTKDNRDEFKRMLADCRNGKIDMVITKSISRFARNTVTLLQYVRELKDIGIDIFFEEQNIHTLSSDGELMLSILASYAQEESLSASENQKWHIKRKFEEGKATYFTLIGYNWVNGVFEIVPGEAEIVKRIYAEYLAGKGYGKIANELNAERIFTRQGMPWSISVVAKVLHNYTYTGNLLLQTTYRENHITKKRMVNRGELPKYRVTDTHEAIIPLEIFNAVQEETELRALHFHKSKTAGFSSFTSLLVCNNCGKHYRRKTTHGGIVWICTTYNTVGKSACASKQIPETTLQSIVAEVLERDTYAEKYLKAQVLQIKVCNGNKLIFQMADGSVVEKEWKDRSRADSWTAEMKENARQGTIERRRRNG